MPDIETFMQWEAQLTEAEALRHSGSPKADAFWEHFVFEEGTPGMQQAHRGRESPLQEQAVRVKCHTWPETEKTNIPILLLRTPLTVEGFNSNKHFNLKKEYILKKQTSQ